MESRKHKLGVIVAKYFLRSERGRTLRARASDPFTDFFNGSVYLLALKGVWGFELKPEYLIYIVIALKIFDYLAGWIDQIRLGFWKVENETSSLINPFNEEMLSRQKHTEEMVEKLLVK